MREGGRKGGEEGKESKEGHRKEEEITERCEDGQEERERDHQIQHEVISFPKLTSFLFSDTHTHSFVSVLIQYVDILQHLYFTEYTSLTCASSKYIHRRIFVWKKKVE